RLRVRSSDGHEIVDRSGASQTRQRPDRMEAAARANAFLAECLSQQDASVAPQAFDGRLRVTALVITSRGELREPALGPRVLGVCLRFWRVLGRAGRAIGNVIDAPPAAFRSLAIG